MHGFDILFHKGVRRLPAVRRTVETFADVLVGQQLIVLPRPFNVELFPVHLICGSPGWYHPADAHNRTPWIELAGLDPKLSPPELLAKYPQDFGDGPWLFRLLQCFAHEIAHGLGADTERAAWRNGNAILSAALIRSPKLRRWCGEW